MRRLVLLVLLLAAGFWLGSQWMHRAGGPGEASPTPFADDMVQLDEPLPGATVSSPLTVRGKARGTWFFEADFPVTLADADGNVLAQAPAQAQGEWMTTDWVPFEVTLTFTADASSGMLTLKKDNPSGLPQYDDSRTIPLLFR